tara:strand:+ start:438 stop:794 length:357 start_codon:yes stop_codon:yes gene_type:complete
MFFILGTLLLFHVLIFTQVIPYDIVWAGKLKSVEEMKSFELVSILINGFILTVLGVKYKLLLQNKTNKLIDILIWLFVVFFTLNTVGNLFSKSILELVLGCFVTLISAILCYIIVRKD